MHGPSATCALATFLLIRRPRHRWRDRNHGAARGGGGDPTNKKSAQLKIQPHRVVAGWLVRRRGNIKLTALKKAYAEIILNTAKEAAARIVVSERKALRFQRELFSTKEEAFRMLLRLKQMLDSKACEAKMMSSSQQKKIDELEAQLQEAEDIVKDLREELSEAQTQLEKATKNQPQPLARESLDSDTAAPGLMISQLSSQIDAVATYEKNSISNGTYEGSRCYSTNDALKDRYCVPNPDFASLVMRSKEPELYRNGCTQRIRAFERNLLDENLSLSGLVDDAKNATFIRGDDEGKGMCNTPKPKVGNTHGVEKNQEQLKVMQLDGSHIQAPAFKSFQNKRKRAARYRRSKAPSCRYLPHQFKEMHQDLSCTITSASSVNNNVLTDNASKKSEDEIRKVTESVLTPKLLSDTTEMSTRSGCSYVTDNDAGFVRPCSVQKAMDNDKMIIEESEMTRQECLSAEKLEILACKTDVEKDNRPLYKSDMRASDLDGGTASQPADNKFLKYTFCRKRKKETLNSPEGLSVLDNGTLERKTGEEQNVSLEPQKSSLLTESSRESRRLAQVARQVGDT
ncbi:hypothetical protein GBA52_017498 [Prunus armeniaca]|nr:hypothetical protein GBA52_017498 [Prunus armeniaca]